MSATGRGLSAHNILALSYAPVGWGRNAAIRAGRLAAGVCRRTWKLRHRGDGGATCARKARLSGSRRSLGCLAVSYDAGRLRVCVALLLVSRLTCVERSERMTTLSSVTAEADQEACSNR